MTLLFNKSYEYENPAFLEVQGKIFQYYSLLAPSRPNWVMPLFLSKHMQDTKGLLSSKKYIWDLVHKMFLEKKPQNDDCLDQEPTCVAEHMWKTVLTEGIPFPESEITDLLFEFLIAGQETTKTTLTWAVLNLLHCPDVQDRIYKELRENFPDKDEMIPLKANSLCPVTMATLDEVQRRTPVLVSGIEHTSDVDIENFHGFRVPKGTRMMPNTTVVYRDPKLWKHPNDFNPDNFLDENGQYQKSKYFIPFMMGLRACPGEAIAKWELFIFFANLMRRFKLVPSGKLVPLTSEIKFVVAAPPFKVILEKREQ